MEKISERKYSLNKFLFAYLLFVLATTLSEENQRLSFNLSVAAFEGDGRMCDGSEANSVEIAMAETTDDPLSLLLVFNRYLESGNSFSSILSYLRAESLEKIVWSHATNNRRLLDLAFESCVDAIEFDVFGGKIGHGPRSSSNLSFERLLETAAAHDGVMLKVDFKDLGSFQPFFTALEKSFFNGPLMINMDLLAGPGSKKTLTSEEIEYFATQANLFPGSILSLGWFTGGYGHKTYTMEMIEEMIDLVKAHGLEQRFLTFPINLKHLAGSEPALSRLLAEFPEATLTVYLSRQNSNSRRQAENILQNYPFLGRVMRDF